LFAQSLASLGNSNDRSKSGGPAWSCVIVRAVNSAAYLLIDISNSFTKLAFSSRTRLSGTHRIPTRELTAAYVRNLLKERNSETVVISSVVPDRNRAIKSAARPRRLLWLSAKINLGVGVEYPAPETIGADRLANAAAVAVLYGCPAVVVDFGTAVTFDIVSARRCYVGGVIAPGLEAMTSFLYQRTALLPKLSLKEPRTAIGKSTADAMMAGAVYGYRGLVREILNRIKAERFPRQRVKLVATGGYAQLIARHLPEIESVHPNLTLEGLRIVAGLNR
jgi:type III pantothenate kinase